MTDYSNLRALDITAETTATFVFELIRGKPSIILAPATDQNAAFLEGRMRLAAEIAELDEPGPLTPATPEKRAADVERNREIDRKLISRHCAKGWGTPPPTADGSVPEFSEEECYAFFRALPAYLFDPLRGFAANNYNFMPRQAQPVDTEKLGN